VLKDKALRRIAELNDQNGPTRSDSTAVEKRTRPR
jgi:hypothetical protein